MKISIRNSCLVFAATTATIFSCVHKSTSDRAPSSEANLFSSMPAKPTTDFQDEKIWAQYCIANRNSTEIPMPNYADADIKSAVRKLTLISPYSYYFYSGPLYAYGLRIGKSKDLVDVPAQFPDVPEVKNGKKNAHAFLTLLCGEFRDRPSLIKDKLKWVLRMQTLRDTPQKKVNLNYDLWSQMSAHSYSRYISNTRQIFEAKQQDLEDQHLRANIGKYNEQMPVEPFTVCETKFIFKKFVETNSLFSPQNDGFKRYKTEYNKFKDRCPKDDLAYFYDFRGDSNFKPNSPESNGMIWYSTTISNSCIRKDGRMVLKDTVKDKFNDPEICEKYFKSPFAYRWSAARAGLAAWMLRDTKHDPVFSEEKENVTIVPHLEPHLKPFGFKMAYNGGQYIPQLEKNEKGEFTAWDDEKGDYVVLTAEQVAVKQAEIDKLKLAVEEKKKQGETILFDYFANWKSRQNEFWKRSDLGFNDIVGFSGSRSPNPNVELAYERLRDAVNRHTDWYASGYDDGLGTVRDQAYSPFVASSYEMSASDGFTAPGATVQSPADGCKHWMFVFKLRADQWYNTKSIMDKKPIDFNRDWFDETSLGTNHLADSEHALDRLGTALEGEMDSILYLNNITTSREVNEKCGEDKLQ